MLCLHVPNPRKPDKLDILYVVVAESQKRKGAGAGSALIRHAMKLEGASSLEAEARNDASKRMLEKCGFHNNGYPILTWTRL